MVSLNCDDEIVFNYLTNLWCGIYYNKLSIMKLIVYIISLFSNLFMTEKKFVSNIRTNLAQLRKLGFKVYHNINLEREMLISDNISNRELNYVYNYVYGSQINKHHVMKKICYCTVFPKYKSGDGTSPTHFRYLINHHNSIKILDRILCKNLIEKLGSNIPDYDIYKVHLSNSYNNNLIDVAIHNTLSIINVILLDITRAFDSLEWNILEELLITNLTRKINSYYANYYVNYYMTIIKNRVIRYKKYEVKVNKGIPTGLPSSNIIFTLALEEIIYRWMNKYNFKQYYDFILNIYVDDIYLKIINIHKTKLIVNSLLSYLNKYKLYVNFKKSRADINLKLNFLQLTNMDCYLGIPFTREKYLYGQIILNNLYSKHNMDLNWCNILSILTSENNDDRKKVLVGFLNYKLKPFNNDNDLVRCIISNFI